MMVKICPVCNMKNDVDAKHCVKCKGYILEEPTLEESGDIVIGVENIEYIIRCPDCDKENDCGRERCIKCGFWLPRVYEPKGNAMIRQAAKTDLRQILRIYESAKAFMHSHGNPNQWNGAYPDENTLLDDIAKGQLFVMADEEAVYGVFALIGGDDETYGYIEGKWRKNTPYGTIHRIAGDGSKRGVMQECFDFAKGKYNHLRVDTHEDNKPMQKAVGKCGFEYAGIIYLKDGNPRLAYDWCEE